MAGVLPAVPQHVVSGVDADGLAFSHLQTGDVIAACNDIPTAQLSHDELLREIASGTLLRLGVVRSDLPVAPKPLAQGDVALAPSSGVILHVAATACDAVVVTGGASTAYGGVFVKEAPAASGLEAGDRILAVADRSQLEATAEECLEALLAADLSAGVVFVTLVRLGSTQWDCLAAACGSIAAPTAVQGELYLRPVSSHWHMTDGSCCAITGPIVVCTVTKTDGRLGVTVTGGTDTNLSGVFVSKLSAASGGSRRGSLRPGDRILAIDGNSLMRTTQQGAGEILLHTGDSARFVVVRLGDHQWRMVSEQAKSSERPVKTKSRPVSVLVDDELLLEFKLNRETSMQPLGLQLGVSLKALEMGERGEGDEVAGGVYLGDRACFECGD